MYSLQNGVRSHINMICAHFSLMFPPSWFFSRRYMYSRATMHGLEKEECLKTSAAQHHKLFPKYTPLPPWGVK